MIAPKLKISIVTISFNQSKYLKQCIESVLNQSYTSFEYIIVDAGSSDGSRELIQSYSDPRLRYVFEPDSGPADGLNKGLRSIQGDIFCYINSDDFFEADAFHELVSIFNSWSSVDIVLSSAFLRNGRGSILRVLHPSKYWHLSLYAIGLANAVQQSTFFRVTSAFKGLMFNVDNKSNWDAEFLVDAVMAGMRVKSFPFIMSSFRVYEGSISGSNKNFLPYINHRNRIRKKILAQYKFPIRHILVVISFILNIRDFKSRSLI
ncbi:glycosyltransferase [Limnobacter sp.]|uniref:glycosyltransferase n=1 Tax=Limnobacter sp. TaxID=2003368 RepID=UPI003BAA0EF2